MRLMWNKKDGGPESLVYMYGFESKRFGSALLLRFENGTREAYHSHAFNCVSWLLSGKLVERFLVGGSFVHKSSPFPFPTYRETFHKVASVGRSWVLTFRGPWVNTWHESEKGKLTTLTHGREVLAVEWESQ